MRTSSLVIMALIGATSGMKLSNVIAEQVEENTQQLAEVEGSTCPPCNVPVHSTGGKPCTIPVHVRPGNVHYNTLLDCKPYRLPITVSGPKSLTCLATSCPVRSTLTNIPLTIGCKHIAKVPVTFKPAGCKVHLHYECKQKSIPFKCDCDCV